MESRVPVQHYNLRSTNSFLGSSLHDLNTVDSRTGEIEGICDVERDAVRDDVLDNDEGSVECMSESYRNSLPLHNGGVEADHSNIENGGPSVGSYDMLTIDDVLPIETARARFLEIVVDHFINKHVVEVAEMDVNYADQSDNDSLRKRGPGEIQYKGDPRFALPLMYVANMYETLVNDVNIRLASLSGMREKTIGIALEAAGGLYRKLAKKFPRKGLCTFKRRELATSVDTRTRFPELVIQEEKRVRFVVVNGLDIVEKPNKISVSDALWFKRLTGRSEAAVAARDYKFYSPRHKYRRVASSTISNVLAFSAYPGVDQEFSSLNELQNQEAAPSKHNSQPQFQPIPQNHHQQSQGFAQTHHCGPLLYSSAISQSISLPCLGNHMPGMAASPAKFCDECGAPYLRDVSKYCSQCGTKRLGI